MVTAKHAGPTAQSVRVFKAGPHEDEEFWQVAAVDGQAEAEITEDGLRLYAYNNAGFSDARAWRMVRPGAKVTITLEQTQADNFPSQGAVWVGDDPWIKKASNVEVTEDDAVTTDAFFEFGQEEAQPQETIEFTVPQGAAGPLWLIVRAADLDGMDYSTCEVTVSRAVVMEAPIIDIEATLPAVGEPYLKGLFAGVRTIGGERYALILFTDGVEDDEDDPAVGNFRYGDAEWDGGFALDDYDDSSDGLKSTNDQLEGIEIEEAEGDFHALEALAAFREGASSYNGDPLPTNPISYLNGEPADGASDWYIPARQECNTIFDEGAEDFWGDSENVDPPLLSAFGTWTSTYASAEPPEVYYLQWDDASTVQTAQTAPFTVRPVRRYRLT